MINQWKNGEQLIETLESIEKLFRWTFVRLTARVLIMSGDFTSFDARMSTNDNEKLNHIFIYKVSSNTNYNWGYQLTAHQRRS